VLLFGTLSVVLLLVSDQVRQQRVLTDLENLRQIADLRTEVALTHLWLEEYVSGDSAVEPAHIARHLEAAQHFYLALDGGLAETGSAILQEEDLVRLHSSLEEFRNLAIERRQGYEKRLSVGIGSLIDSQYDAVFEELLGSATGVEDALAAEARRHRERSRRLFLGIVAGWSFLVLLAVVASWSRERQRLQVEEVLEESRYRLLESQKMDAVGRLAGGLAHDINNYLAAIRGHTELVLLKPPEAERLRHKMRAVLRTVEKATQLLDRLLTFSRRRAPRLETVHLNELVLGLDKMLRPSLGETIRLELDLAEDLWWVAVDPGQVEQALVNLVMNARNAMPGGGTLQILTVNEAGEDPAGDRVRLTVSDQGCGIPEEALGKIFEPFWTTRKDQGGSGLGLAVVYGVVHQCGGRIDVASEVGVGTTFDLYLPRTTAPPPEAAAPSEGEELGGDATLLLVDDNAEFRAATASLLEGLGYQVVTAPDAERALATFRDLDHDVDVVLSDLVMPGMDGRELVERLRREKADLQVIFLSGHGEEVLRAHGLAVGDQHLAKGELTAARLDGLLRQMLEAPSSSIHVASGTLEP
jgi:signal transduction histidine kinase